MAEFSTHLPTSCTKELSPGVKSLPTVFMEGWEAATVGTLIFQRGHWDTDLHAHGENIM